MPESSLSLQQYNEAFRSALEGLNPAQQEAVDQLEGPVLVIAGPGTGKTHILTARIGRILLETDTKAHNILCLTFTDAGVQAMRERLLQFIGPEAHSVHIYTFHSFCNTVIQDHLELFGRHDLEPLSDLERVEIIRNIIDHLDVEHPLKQGRANMYFYERHLYDLFKQMKMEAWSVTHIHKEVDAYLADLPNRKEYVYQVSRGAFKKGQLKEAKLRDEQLKMERLKAAAALYPDYQAALRRIRRYDYDDMILWVLDAFQRNEALLRTYQEQYLYLLVDEYQDTNGAQNAIIKKLIDYWDNPNIFIVGDDDQSIYEFQGARLKNLSDFYLDYAKEIQLVVLKDNYRSSQNILDIAHQLIQNNEKRIISQFRQLGLEKNLNAANEEVIKTSAPPTLSVYPNRMHEDTAIAESIESLWNAGFPLYEIAVIYARHRQIKGVQQLLERKGIPYYTRKKINILDQPLIQNLRTLLTYLELEWSLPYSGEYLLFKILHFRFWGIPSRDIARLSYYSAGKAWSQRPQWRDLIATASQNEAIELEQPDQLMAFSHFIENSLQQIASISLPGFIEIVINKSGLLAAVLEHPERSWQLQLLKTFMDFVQEEAERSPRISLKRLLEILEKLDANYLPIELQKTIGTTEGVHLLTAHSSKGLEFGHVYVLDCVKAYWEPGGKNSSYRFALPDTLTFSGEEDAVEARRRLFFVAITRAKSGLHLSYSKENLKGKPLERLRFLDEVNIEEVQHELDEQQLLASSTIQLQAPPTISIQALDPVWVNEMLEGFSLSITAMNRFLKCPLSFYYEHVLKVPAYGSEAANYGQAMHNALQRLFEMRSQDKGRAFQPVAVFLSIFEKEMQKLRGFFGEQTFQRRLEMGLRHLRGFYMRNVDNWKYRSKVEWPFRNVEIDGVPIKGLIDRVDFIDGSNVHLIDYKTGSHDNTRLKRPTKSNTYGGSYWRQLVFYKILFEAGNNMASLAKKGTIVYLRPDAHGNYLEETVSFNANDTSLVRSWIQMTYKKIMAHEFYEGCGLEECPWCTFVRQNQFPESFSDPELEALDD